MDQTLPMQIGTKLRDARLDRNLTLRDISRVTKISVRLLEAIERDDLAAMPGDFFARAFLRAYAAEVGLNPAEIVGDYVKQLSPAAVRLDEPPEPTAAPHVDVRWLVLALAVCVTTALGAWGLVYAYQRQSRKNAAAASSPAIQSLGVGSTEKGAAAPVRTPDRPEEGSGPPETAWPSKPGGAETSVSAADNVRPPQLKPAPLGSAPRERVETRKPAGRDASEPAAAETSNQPVEQRPVEATATVPPNEPNPNQDRIQ